MWLLPVVPVAAPDGESTRIGGRSAPTTAFSQNLTPSDVDFSTLGVIERDGGDGVDYCYFVGSTMDEYLTISGGDWPVYTNNSWGDDYQSWDVAPGVAPDPIGYYRARTSGDLPCTAFVTQHMDVMRPDLNGNGLADDDLYYTSNSSRLANQIGATTIMNVRDAVPDTMHYP